MAESSSADALPCKVLLRSKEGVECYEVADNPSDIQTPTSNSPRPFLCQGATSIPLICSPDGSHAFIHMTGVGIVKCPIQESVQELASSPVDTSTPFFADSKAVQMMDLSPQGNFLLTWERWYQDACPNNLKVWNTTTGKCVAAFSQRNIKRDVWPYVQWTHDEKIAVHVTTSEVRFYPASSLRGEGDAVAVRYSDELRIQNVASISLPRASTGSSDFYLLTAFVPGTKDKPARAGLYKFLPGGQTKADTPPLLSKSLFQAEDMKVTWNPAGDAALLTLQTAVDTSGQSYYGSSQLFMLRYGETEVVAVPLQQEGPVADVAWLPDASKPPCFVVVAGKMPSLASLHHGKTGKATFLFGNAHRNVVSWAPHGRFLCLAGFGNLAGGMSFWDRNKQKLINNGCVENAKGSLRAESAVVGYDWSPSSRWFLCSTCSPRMNVDNGVRLFRYNGQSVKTLPWNNEHYLPDKLLQACFVPANPTVYEDRPQSPPPEGMTEATSVTAPVAIAAAPKPAGRYVPPSARGRAGGGTSLAERMRREKEGNLQSATRVIDTKVKTPTGVKNVVGMSQPTQSKSKSQLKREKEKKKKQQEAEQAANAAAAAVAEPSTVDPEKRARKIKKTLKQIDDLKSKDASTLNDDQKAKIASEADLRAELAKLGL